MTLPSSLLFQVAFFLSGLLAIPSLLGHESPRIEFIGTASIPGDASDLSGDAALLENGEPRNRLGGFSALDFSGKGNIYAALLALFAIMPWAANCWPELLKLHDRDRWGQL